MRPAGSEEPLPSRGVRTKGEYFFVAAAAEDGLSLSLAFIALGEATREKDRKKGEKKVEWLTDKSDIQARRRRRTKPGLPPPPFDGQR